MDQSNVAPMEGIGVASKRKRSQMSRRGRRSEPQSAHDPLTTPVSDDMSKISSNENIGDGNFGEKMFYLSRCVLRSLPVSGSNGGMATDKTGGENKPKKVNLKVGGVTHTLQTKSSSNGESDSVSLVKTKQSLENSRQHQRLIHQGSSVEHHFLSLDKKGSLQGIPWKDFAKSSFNIVREEMGRISTKTEKQGDKSDSAHRSKRAPRKRVLGDEFDEDDEIRYLENLKTSKMSGYKDLDARKSRSGDMDYEEEDEIFSDCDPDDKKKKQQKKYLTELPIVNKREIGLTTRQRALLSKDAFTPSGGSPVEFPNGLPPAPPRKQKEKLTEMEQQLKKVEAAQRRKLQNEKAARESEAEAIRKILGQDSSRKKREDKIKKRREELTQEKATSVEMLSSNTIRTVMGVTGTTVTFPIEIGLPALLTSKKCSYPPTREKCAGPSCNNPYKYRDSMSKVPLCSLECYKAVNDAPTPIVETSMK